MTDKIQTDYKSLKEFTENASHEIQTPLAVINSKLELLMQSENFSETRNYESVFIESEDGMKTGIGVRRNRYLLPYNSVEAIHIEIASARTVVSMQTVTNVARRVHITVYPSVDTGVRSELNGTILVTTILAKG